MHVRIIDANSVGYAQHHANDVRTAQQMQTQAVAGMLQHIRKNLQFDAQVLNILVWDGRAQWRYDLHPGYKAGRHRTAEQRETRQQYEVQRPWIQKALCAFPVLQVTHPHAEADDLAFGLSRQLSAQGHLVTLFTADSDWLQMVNARTRWVNARKPTHVVELADFHRTAGYSAPGKVPDIKALMGDTADDIEGLMDVGDKRAAALIAKYDSLEQVLIASEDFLQFSSEAKYFHALMNPETRTLMQRNLRLVDLSRGPALHGEDVLLQVGEFNELDLFEVFVDLNFLQWQDGFDQWQRSLGKPLNTADVHSVKRAVAGLKDSWPLVKG